MTINTVKFLDCVFFPIQQWTCHNNIVTDRVSSLFDDCPAEYVARRVYLFFPWAHRTPTKINKNGAVAKVRILVELGIL